MNIILKDAYADALLLNVKISKPGAAIKRDAYADELLHYIHDKGGTTEFHVNNTAPEYVMGKDKEK